MTFPDEQTKLDGYTPRMHYLALTISLKQANTILNIGEWVKFFFKFSTVVVSLLIQTRIICIHKILGNILNK